MHYHVSVYIPIAVAGKADYLALGQNISRSPFLAQIIALGLKFAPEKLAPLIGSNQYWHFGLSGDLYDKVNTWAAKHKINRSEACAHLISVGLEHSGLKTPGEKFEEKWKIQWRRTLGDKLFDSTKIMAEKRQMSHKAVVEELWRSAIHICESKVVRKLIESSIEQEK